jgi:hypothetical protein
MYDRVRDAREAAVDLDTGGRVGLILRELPGREAGVLESAVTLTAPTWEMRPDLPQEYLDAHRAQLGEDAFRTDFGAEFVAGGGAVFDLRGVEFSSRLNRRFTKGR